MLHAREGHAGMGVQGLHARSASPGRARPWACMLSIPRLVRCYGCAAGVKTASSQPCRAGHMAALPTRVVGRALHTHPAHAPVTLHPCHPCQAAEEAKRNAAEREAAVRTGNPLLAISKDGGGGGGDVDFGIKRRWDDDVVFKNQTRGEVKAPRRFINDTVRSDFHRRFLERYIR